MVEKKPSLEMISEEWEIKERVKKLEECIENQQLEKNSVSMGLIPKTEEWVEISKTIGRKHFNIQ